MNDLPSPGSTARPLAIETERRSMLSTTLYTAPQLIWRNSGRPEPKWEPEPHAGACATCGAPILDGVPTEAVNNPTFANHAEFFKFGTHVCRACAWMYSEPKKRHRNVLAVGEEVYWPMISVESATAGRPSWQELLRREWPEEEPWCGVLTTDPKPRLWPRMRLASSSAPGLYVHAPDYDISEWRAVDLSRLRELCALVRECLLLRLPKSRIHSGLLGDYRRASKCIEEVMSLEMRLREARGSPEFVPALLVTGITKEEKDEARTNERAGNTRRSDRGRAARRAAREGHDRLF